MDSFDDIQVEDFSAFDFVEEMTQSPSNDKNDEKSFQTFLNSNWDY